MAKNLYPVFDRIYDRKVKEEILRQSAKVIWFTGKSKLVFWPAARKAHK